MRKIIVSTFMTTDGVLLAPGGPDEDRRGGFKWGGWLFAHSNEVTDKALAKIMSNPFDLLPGRHKSRAFIPGNISEAGLARRDR